MDSVDLVKLKMEYRDGGLYWKAHDGMTGQWAGRFLGKKVKGCATNQGYVNITLGHKGKKLWISYHRAVYILVWGDVPEGHEIDHIDRNKLNNDPLNLRSVTRSVNIRNRVLPASATTGFQHIQWAEERNGYIVKFQHPENRYEKQFPTLELAVAARDEQYALRGLSFH